MSFQVLVWLGKDGIADARLIYGVLVNEARVRLRTRTTYWRNDSAKLQDAVRKKFARHVPDVLMTFMRSDRGDNTLRRR